MVINLNSNYAYFGMVGMSSQTLYPLTVTNLYSKVVMPTVLYGC